MTMKPTRTHLPSFYTKVTLKPKPKAVKYLPFVSQCSLVFSVLFIFLLIWQQAPVKEEVNERPLKDSAETETEVEQVKNEHI
jgi:hypothetical protein